MATGRPIEARLRIAADMAQAIASLKNFRRELLSTKDAAKSGGSSGGPGPADIELQLPGANSADEIKRRQAAERERKRFADEAIKDTRRLAHEQRQLSAQLTDIAVGLSTGQSPFYVLLQQGGQLRDMFGGVGGAVRALASTLTPLRIAAGAVAAVLGTVALQAFKGRGESEALRKSFALTGNAAGTTAGQLDTQVREIATRQRAAITGVRETMTSLVASGAFTGETLRSAGRAATAWAKLTGESGAEVAKQFDGMGDDVVAWAQKTNRAYNFLNVEQFKYVQSLQAQGRNQEAARIVLEALANTMEARAVPASDKLDSALGTLKTTLATIADQWRGLLRDETFEQRVQQAKAQLEQLERARVIDRGGRRRGTYDANLGKARDSVAVAESDARQARLLADREAALTREQQDKILRETKGFQDQLAALLSAQAQRRLAERTAALGREQAALDRLYAREQITEGEHARKMIEIEQQRLIAERTMLEEQRRIEAGRKVEKVGDEEAKLTALAQLDGQLAQVRGALVETEEKLRATADVEHLNRSRQLSQAWAAMWERAANQVRQLRRDNATAAAEEVRDPLERARAEAETKTENMRRELLDLQRDIRNQLDVLEGSARIAEQQALSATNAEDKDRFQALADSLRQQRPQLLAELEQLGEQGAIALSRGFRKAELTSLLGSVNQVLETIRTEEAKIAQQVEADTLGTIEGERKKMEIRAASMRQAEEMLARLEQLASTDAEKDAVAKLRRNFDEVKNAAGKLEEVLRGSFKSTFQTLFVDVITGSEKAGDAFKRFLASIARSVLDLIAQELGKKLWKDLLNIFNSMGKGSSGSGSSGFWSTLVNWVVGLFHGGGVVGEPGGMTRAVSPLAALRAISSGPRYHSGGVVGLGSDEELAVLRRGEEVLTRDDPRHVRNRGSSPVVGAINISVSVEGGEEGGPGRVAVEQFARGLRARVQETIADEMRPGGLLAGFQRA